MVQISEDAVAERLMRYARIDTQSDPTSNEHPTTAKQKDLSKLLFTELRGMGFTDGNG
jgi:tripeptide aminopeptidase